MSNRKPLSKAPLNKFNETKRSEFLRLLSEGARRGAAATAVGVSRQTVFYLMRDDPKFRNAVDQAEMDANELVEDALFQSAISGNVVAIQVWLYNRSSDRWRDRRNILPTVAEEEFPSQPFKIVKNEKMAG